MDGSPSDHGHVLGTIPGRFSILAAIIMTRGRRFGAERAVYRLDLHHFLHPRREAQANLARLMNSQAEKKSFNHALYPIKR